MSEKKKRKRRSFWEPESEKLVQWLDAQTDLGTSLQLIIVDAIHKYGEGDVIKAHLNQRENFYYDTEPQTPVRKPAPTKVATQPEPDVPNHTEDIAPSFISSEQTDDVATPHVSEPEDEQHSGGGLELETDTELELDDDPMLDIADIMSEDDEDIEEEEQQYDPIAIMMNDIGSTIRK